MLDWLFYCLCIKIKINFEADLMRSVFDSDLKNEQIDKKAEQELFYKQMLRLFGEYENFPAEDSLKTYFDDTFLLYLYINTLMEII
jgi:hypothetical protein